jgi:hypothetical protein
MDNLSFSALAVLIKEAKYHELHKSEELGSNSMLLGYKEFQLSMILEQVKVNL